MTKAAHATKAKVHRLPTRAFEAEVIALGDDEVRLRSTVDGEESTALPAVVAWSPSVGDRVVALDGFVIGVRSCRTVALRVEKGDLLLEAPAGSIVLRSARVETIANEVASLVGKVEIKAERIIERAVDVYRDVEGTLQTRAGRVRTLVQDAFRLFARRTDVRSREDTSIDGKRVLLG
jgi:Protein of unknown function (DUF3540)